MSQEYQDISVTEKVSDSLSKLLERDETGATLSAGTSAPASIAPWMIGRVFLKTDSKTLSYLSSVDPVNWTPMLDFSQPLATLQQVQAGYQPLNSNLTALSQLVVSANTIPYFKSATTMDILSVTSFNRSLFQANNASAVRTLLGLGSLATVNSITSSNANTYIDNSSLPISKFSFTPITKGEGYTVGDVKETYYYQTKSEANADGWCKMNMNYTIGDSSSGASYAGNDYQSLYSKIWGLANVDYYTSSGDPSSKGNNGWSSDWNAHKRITLPKGTNYLNSDCYFLIRYK